MRYLYRYLRTLLLGHEHEFELNYLAALVDDEGNEIPVYQERCTICGASTILTT